jgi:membrane-associated phospholipid phosphatase
MGRRLSALVLRVSAGAALLFAVSPLLAQKAGPAPRQQPATTDQSEHDDARDDLVEQLLVPEGATDSDLRWLYSDAEEYAPSDLVGKPVPAPGLPERGEGSRRKWDPRWQRFELGHYVLTGSTLAIAAASFLIPTSPDRWRGKNGIDEAVRDGISIEDYPRGQWARDVSDILLSVEISYPLLVDSLIVTYWYRRSEDVANQMALITAEALGVTATLQGLTSAFTSRERPYGRNCGTSIEEKLDDCQDTKRYRSFFSGHTSLSFAAAGVTCSHHARHQVFGDPLADGLACGTALTAAGVVGAMRVVGDQHYLSDVVAGAAIGMLGGLGVPWLLHYGPPARREAKGTRPAGVAWTVVPTGGGASIAGRF